MTLRPVLITGTGGRKGFTKVGKLPNSGSGYRCHHSFHRPSNHFAPIELACKRLGPDADLLIKLFKLDIFPLS